MWDIPKDMCDLCRRKRNRAVDRIRKEKWDKFTFFPDTVISRALGWKSQRLWDMRKRGHIGESERLYGRTFSTSEQISVGAAVDVNEVLLRTAYIMDHILKQSMVKEAIGFRIINTLE